MVLGDVVADRSGNHFSRSIASLAARSARIAVATDDDAGVQVRATVAVERPPAPSYPAGARIMRTELLSSSGDHARIDKGLLASLKANSMPPLWHGLINVEFVAASED